MLGEWVDFAYEVDGKVYAFTLPGGGWISFRTLAEALSLGGDDVAAFVRNIDQISFSDPSLIWAGKAEEDITVGQLKEANHLKVTYSAELEESRIEAINAQVVPAGDWALISLKPFTSEETLTVTMKDGEVFTVKVTDNQAADPLGLDGQTYVITNGDYAVRAQEMTNGGYTFLRRNSISSDAWVKWKFVYDAKAFPVDPSGTYNRGGYYLYNESTGKYMKISGTNQNDGSRGVTLVDSIEEASPLKVEYNTGNGQYRISNQQNGLSGFLTNIDNGWNSCFGVSNSTDNTSWMTLMDPNRPTQMPGTVGTWDIKSDGIVLKMFDYEGKVWYNNATRDIDDVWGSQTNGTALRAGSGINNGRSLLFSGSGLENQEGFNNFTGRAPNGPGYYSGYVYQGIVERGLNASGYPVLTSDKRVTNTDRNSGGSLQYLFDDANIANAKTAYTGENNSGLQGLLRKDAEGYYYYDSENNYARMQGNELILYDRTYNKGASSTGVETKKNKIGFFPFDNYQPDKKEEKGPAGSVYDHQFGMTLSTSFIYPKDGKVKVPDTDRKNDMIFEFSGDDDVWVFVDGVLVLDLGGVHQPIRGIINFATGAVTIYEYGNNGNEYVSSKSTTIDAMFDAYNVGRPADQQKHFDKTKFSEHTLDFFYLERGGCDSNCAIKFNLLTQKTFSLTKKLNGLTEAEKEKYKDETFDFEVYVNDELYNGNDTLITEADGTVKEGNEDFTITDGKVSLKPGQTLTIFGLSKSDTFYVVEKKTDVMDQFEDPRSERIYTDENAVSHEEEISLTEDENGWSTDQTHPYAVSDTSLVAYNNTLKEKNLEVEKEWADDEDHSADAIKFTVDAKAYTEGENGETYLVEALKKNGNSTSNDKEFTLNSGNDWKTKIEHLPAVTPEGKDIVYTVTEATSVSGYTSTVVPVLSDKCNYDAVKLWPDAETHDEVIRVRLKNKAGKYFTGLALYKRDITEFKIINTPIGEDNPDLPSPEVEYHKRIDALRDGRPNADTDIDEEDDLTDLYRLYLDYKINSLQEPEGVDLLFVIDHSGSMNNPAYGGNEDRAPAVMSALNGDDGVIARFLNMNDNNRWAAVGFKGAPGINYRTAFCYPYVTPGPWSGYQQPNAGLADSEILSADQGGFGRQSAACDHR